MNKMIAKNLPTEQQLDEMSARTARIWLNRLYEVSPEVVEAIWSATTIASPSAGPVRVLREVVSHFTTEDRS